MISYKDAYSIIQSKIQYTFPDWYSKNAEIVNISEVLGRILSNPIEADIDQPYFDSSAMDGIVIKYKERDNNWKIVSEIKAGLTREVVIHEGECALIMTGAEIPENMDTVIPVELLDIKENIANLKEESLVKKGMNIRYKGENIQKGEISIPAYTLIKASHISSITACGLIKVSVIRKPIIGIISSGDELVEPDIFPEKGEVRATNLYSLQAQCVSNGFIPRIYGIIPDGVENLKNIIIRAGKECDIVLTTGGASVGKYDFVETALKELGSEIVLSKSNIKPGKPMVFGIVPMSDKKLPVFCLPGNPVSSFVNFSIYISPIIKTVLFKQNKLQMFNVISGEDIKKKDKKTHFVRGKLIFENTSLVFYPQGSNSSADMQGLSGSGCFGIIEENILNPKKGDKISCMMI